MDRRGWRCGPGSWPIWWTDYTPKGYRLILAVREEMDGTGQLGKETAVGAALPAAARHGRRAKRGGGSPE